MKRYLLAGCLAVGSALAAPALEYETFRSPDRADEPEVWFHFIGGNVAREGLEADLDAISAGGFSGIQFFHEHFGKAWPGVTRQVRCMSEPWFEIVGQMADLCKQKGLRLSAQNCPGWAMAGGPWIAPSNAMRTLVVSRKDFKGGKVDAALSRPGGNESWRDYRDIAVLAFPTPAGDTGHPLATVAEEGNPTNPAGLVVSFAQPETVRTIEWPCIKGMNDNWVYEPHAEIVVEALTPDGAVEVVRTEVPAANWQDASPFTIACKETAARKYRAAIRCPHELHVGKIHFYSAARRENWEAEACQTLRALLHNPAREQSSAAWVATGGVRDISGFMNAEGTLSWQVPEGNWAVLRFGHVNAGRKNGPAPEEATGWECDKLSTVGADTHFPGYIGRLVAADGPFRGKLATMFMDSWECANQTWTPGLDAEFKKRYGYSLFPRMPALFGWVVDNPEDTARFLCDWRRMLSDLIVSNFYGRMAALAHSRGLQVQFETAFGDVLCGDIMEYYKYADIPTCEFWSPRTENFVGSFNYKPVKPTISAARMYGKRRVAAEAFTSFQLTWDEKLRDLKYVADLHLAEGITHLAFQNYTHNPRTDGLPPGTAYGESWCGIGTPFLRAQTWWRAMPKFTAYLSRCQRMLEDGLPVSDVLWYLGDELGHKPFENAPFPAGYRYDYCNPDALLTRIQVEDGLWKTPEGISYRVLWMPDCGRMRPETLEKLADLCEKGGKMVVPSLPRGLATLGGGKNAQARFTAAFQRLFGKESNFVGTRPCGQGSVCVGKPLGEALETYGVAPDVTAEGIVWQHRHTAEKDCYFVTAKSPDGFSGEVSFRAEGTAEIWDAVTGEKFPADVREQGKARTRLALDLPRSGSCFVVFEPGKQTRKTPPPAQPSASKKISPWVVSFPAGWGIGKPVVMTNLVAWKDMDVSPEGRAFSGTATYSAGFSLSPEKGARYTLDLGQVESIAEVTLNGKKLATLWCEPYRLDVTDALRVGRNTLELAVTGTWFNRLAYDAAQPESVCKTWTFHAPAKDSPLRVSGCLGPVALNLKRAVGTKLEK